MRKLFSILLCSLFLNVSTAEAQPTAVDRWTPPLPTKTERTIADIASWGTAFMPVAMDTKVSWDSVDRAKAFLLQGVRVGATYGMVFLVKQLVHRQRPCAPDDCGPVDNPNFSFYSGHTALAFQATGGPRLAVSLPFQIATGGLRVAAGKHWLTDVLVGSGAGLLAGRIR